MMKAPERRKLQAIAQDALAGSATWTGWVRIVNRPDEDGGTSTWVVYGMDGRDQDTWVRPEAIHELARDRAERIAPRLFA